MQQYFINISLKEDMTITLNKEQSHHILRVLRMRDNQHIRLVDITENVFLASIVTKNPIEATVLQQLPKPKAIQSKITLVVSMIKQERWNWLLQKATECGAMRIVPMITRRSVVSIDPKDWSKKSERYNKITLEAAEQSYRTNLCVVTDPINLEDVHQYKSQINVIAYEKEEASSLFEQVKANQSVTLVIGPEGGFDPSEVLWLQQHGFTSVSLGPRIYRTETAAIVGCTIIEMAGQHHD